jgi:hypothetical protein
MLIIPLVKRIKNKKIVINDFLENLLTYVWPHVATRVYILKGFGVVTRLYFGCF